MESDKRKKKRKLEKIKKLLIDDKYKVIRDKYVFYKNGHKLIKKDGYILTKYLNVTKNIKFKNKAVNDYNQHLCGGWTVLPHNEFEEVDRVVKGLKPVGVSHSRDLDKIKNKVIELEKNKDLLISWHVGKVFGYFITASPKTKLKDYFDMETLAKDYETNGINSENITSYQEKDFSIFHNDKYDVEDHPIEIIGLILGYPIENTISRMKYNYCGEDEYNCEDSNDYDSDNN